MTGGKYRGFQPQQAPPEGTKLRETCKLMVHKLAEWVGDGDVEER